MARPVKDASERLSKRLPHARCSEHDYAVVSANAKFAQMSLSKYVVRMARDGQVVVVRSDTQNDYLPFEKAFTYRLKNQTGKWLNTLAHRANATGELPSALWDCLKEVEHLLDTLIFTMQMYKDFAEKPSEQGRQDNVIDNHSIQSTVSVAFVFQITAMKKNLTQLGNIAKVREIEPRELGACQRQVDQLLFLISPFIKTSVYDPTGNE